MESALDIDVEASDDACTLRLTGEVDLGGVTFVDSSGIGVLLSARERFTSDGRSFVVARASDIVRQVFAYTGLSWLLTGGEEGAG